MSIRRTVFLGMPLLFALSLHGCSDTSKSSVFNKKNKDEQSESQVPNANRLMRLENDNNFNPPALSVDQAKELLNAKLDSPNTGKELEAIVVPSYVPPNYEVGHFKASSFLENTDYFYEYYVIVYKDNSSDSCFLISASALDTDDAGASATEVETIKKIKVEDLEIEVELGFVEFDQSKNSSLSISVLGGQGEFEGSTWAHLGVGGGRCAQKKGMRS